jgi:deferrochelatase/peroxidase EfeB
MFVEHWDRTSLGEQEAIMGRHKGSGAPLGGEREEDAPVYDDDPDGRRTPLDAHIRLANPRTLDTADSLILRRGFSYSAGFDRAGQLDQGLAFVCFQRELEKGFLAVQARLDGEPLEEYVLPVGGGFFFALPGTEDPDRPLGADLLAP